MTEENNLSVPPTDPNRERFVSELMRHHGRLFSYIYSLVANWQDAQDVLQQTSLVLWRKYHEFDPDSDFLAWASRVAFYEAKNFIRHIARDRHQFDDDLLEIIARERVPDTARSDRRARSLQTCLGKLPADDRTLLTRVYERRASGGDLAAGLGIAAQSLYNRLHRLRKRLSECVEHTLAAEDGLP